LASVIPIAVDYCSIVDSMGVAGDNARHSGPNQIFSVRSL